MFFYFPSNSSTDFVAFLSFQAVAPELYNSIYSLLVAQGLEKSASALLKEAKFEKKAATEELSDVFTFYKTNNK